ncbi:hypothetical protein [Legionella sp. km772]|uniref:hypothetical protein n=1 Tax=Legionella sp. km772 TaxID=2498111 RepID=UPI000F8E727C|nr:hypothetical protein [Legionella sp. km772]RUR05324.1 hypothetical protein ELY15_14460 [Legionella sp. km772]
MRTKLALLLFVICFYSHADNQASLGDWTQNLLTATLSASYKDTPAQIAELRKNYLPQAWGPMIQFLRDKRIQINEQKLILHPLAVNSPEIMESNQCGIAPCWQVTQSFDIPELKVRLAFVLQVIPGEVAKNAGSFVVQSVSMSMNPMP